jgi:hypothetical protein
MNLVRYADRADLLERRDLSEQTFPEFVLAPLEVRDETGRHVEPNVWVRHRL